MLDEAEEQNFWPGYLDALINVMLNLLFLVAIFAMGLVSLNLQTVSQMKQISGLTAAGLVAQDQQAGWEAGAKVDDKDTGTEAQIRAQRLEILRKLDGLDLNALLVQREALDRQRQFTALQTAALIPSTKSVSKEARRDNPSASDTEAGEKRLTEINQVDLEALKAANSDKQKQLEDVSVQLKEVGNAIAREKMRLTAFQAQRAQLQPEQAHEFRTAARVASPESAEKIGSKALSTKEILLSEIGRNPQVSWEFAPNDFVWSASRDLPEGILAADKTADWHLLGFVDPSNARVRREVFARIQAIRNLLIDQGFPADKLRLELRPIGKPQGVDDQAHRFIFMLPQS